MNRLRRLRPREPRSPRWPRVTPKYRQGFTRAFEPIALVRMEGKHAKWIDTLVTDPFFEAMKVQAELLHYSRGDTA